jgi:CENP-S associating Centromere protein X
MATRADLERRALTPEERTAAREFFAQELEALCREENAASGDPGKPLRMQPAAVDALAHAMCVMVEETVMRAAMESVVESATGGSGASPSSLPSPQSRAPLTPEHLAKVFPQLLLDFS